MSDVGIGTILYHKEYGKGHISSILSDNISIVFMCENGNDFHEKTFLTSGSPLFLDIELSKPFVAAYANIMALKQKELTKRLENMLQKPHPYQKKQKDQTWTFLESRGLYHILHMTRMENLISVLQHGLVPVSLQDEMNILSVHNDLNRIDHLKEYTSFSFGFPNYLMFTKYMYSKTSRWVIIKLNAEILLSENHHVIYFQTNASRRKNCELPTYFQDGLTALEAMFSPSVIKKNGDRIMRSSLSITDNMTTDPQAEVMIKGIVDPHWIKEISFQNKDDYYNFCRQTVNLTPQLPYMHTEPALFSYRTDSEYWRSSN